ncbi:hypothetical protein EYR36_010001 [Pleurotus pulmonarius]|nr:hypothetical protein EYR36_010001 [Pleurotus pulmonarius]
MRCPLQSKITAQIFKGLTSLTITRMEPWSMDALPSFVEHVAPSIEILHLDAAESIPPSSLSRCMAQILCDNALTMPNLRKLTTHLMVSPDPTLIFHKISTKCKSLTKLDLYISVDGPLDVPLNKLALPYLRILYLSFGPNTPIVDLWDGQCGLAALNEFRIKERCLRLEELDSMGRFFAKTTLVSLSIRVFALDGPVLRVLADYLPMLRNLDLFADHLLRPGLLFSERAMAHTLNLKWMCRGGGSKGGGSQSFLSLSVITDSHGRGGTRNSDPVKKLLPSWRAVSQVYERRTAAIITSNILLRLHRFEHEASRVRYRSVTLSNKQLVDFPLAVDSNPENALRVVSLTIRGVRFESPDPYHNLDYILSKSHGAGDASDQLELGALRRVPRARCALPVGADDVDLAQQ